MSPLAPAASSLGPAQPGGQLSPPRRRRDSPGHGLPDHGRPDHGCPEHGLALDPPWLRRRPRAAAVACLAPSEPPRRQVRRQHRLMVLAGLPGPAGEPLRLQPIGSQAHLVRARARARARAGASARAGARARARVRARARRRGRDRLGLGLGLRLRARDRARLGLGVGLSALPASC